MSIHSNTDLHPSNVSASLVSLTHTSTTVGGEKSERKTDRPNLRRRRRKKRKRRRRRSKLLKYR